MTILKLNYENVVAAHHSQQPGHADRHVSDQIKFQVVGAQGYVFKGWVSSYLVRFSHMRNPQTSGGGNNLI